MEAISTLEQANGAGAPLNCKDTSFIDLPAQLGVNLSDTDIQGLAHLNGTSDIRLGHQAAEAGIDSISQPPPPLTPVHSYDDGSLTPPLQTCRS